MRSRHLAGGILATLLLAGSASAQTLPGIVPEDEVVRSADAARAYGDALAQALEADARLVQGAAEALLAGTLAHAGPLAQLLQGMAAAFGGAARDAADDGAPGTCAELAAAHPGYDPTGTWAGAAEACAGLAAELEASYSGLPFGGFP